MRALLQLVLAPLKTNCSQKCIIVIFRDNLVTISPCQVSRHDETVKYIGKSKTYQDFSHFSSKSRTTIAPTAKHFYLC